MTDRNKSTANTAAHLDPTARRVLFIGHVQGVGFRYTARQVAQQYNVSGFVRNLPDGTVEMHIQGPAQEIDHCIADIQASFKGYLRDTRIEPAAYSPRYTDFRIAF